MLLPKSVLLNTDFDQRNCGKEQEMAAQEQSKKRKNSKNVVVVPERDFHTRELGGKGQFDFGIFGHFSSRKCARCKN